MSIIVCIGILIANSDLKPLKIEFINNDNMLEIKDEVLNLNDDEFEIVDEQFETEYFRKKRSHGKYLNEIINL
jgi:hypothetical protein